MTVIVGPDPIELVPHELSYQFQTAPVPRFPPDKLKLVESPEQKLLEVVKTPEGAIEPSLVKIVMLLQSDEPQVPVTLA